MLREEVSRLRGIVDRIKSEVLADSGIADESVVPTLISELSGLRMENEDFRARLISLEEKITKPKYEAAIIEFYKTHRQMSSRAEPLKSNRTRPVMPGDSPSILVH
mgnify:CR=1 FL=1